MSTIDEKKLLTDEEREDCKRLLKLYDFKPHDFLFEVTEDQGPMDMNDLKYIIILKVKVIRIKNNKAQTYFSQLGSKTWIAEFEHDLQNKYFESS